MCEREWRRSHVPLYSVLAELSHSEAALPGKIAWNLNLVVLFWDTHTLTHTAWPLAEEDTRFSSRFLVRGEFIRRDLFLLSMFDSSRTVLPWVWSSLLPPLVRCFCLFVYWCLIWSYLQQNPQSHFGNRTGLYAIRLTCCVISRFLRMLQCLRSDAERAFHLINHFICKHAHITALCNVLRP